MPKVGDIERQFNEAIGAQARAIRRAQGMSLRQMVEVAKENGVERLTFSTIAVLERGERDWTTSYFARVAVALGVTTRELTAGLYVHEHSLPILTQASVRR